MDTKAAEEFLDELFSSLESLETQSAAVLEFLKHHTGATNEQLAPYFQQAGNASNVRWRAARLRLLSLLAVAMKDAQPANAAPQARSHPAKSTAEQAEQPAGQQQPSPDTKSPEHKDAQPGEEQRKESSPGSAPEKQPDPKAAPASDAASKTKSDAA